MLAKVEGRQNSPVFFCTIHFHEVFQSRFARIEGHRRFFSGTLRFTEKKSENFSKNSTTFKIDTFFGIFLFAQMVLSHLQMFSARKKAFGELKAPFSVFGTMKRFYNEKIQKLTLP